MKIVKVEAGWVVQGNAGAFLATCRTRDEARAWVRAQKNAPTPEALKAFYAQLEAELVASGAIPTTDVAIPVARPFEPSRYVGRTSLGLVLVAALPFDAFMGRPALGPGRCYNLDLDPLRPRYAQP